MLLQIEGWKRQGSTPELSENTGKSQFTLIEETFSSRTMSLGHLLKVGGSLSMRESIKKENL